MKLCRSSIDIDKIMNPRNINSDDQLEDPSLQWTDAMDGQELIVRRDMEPPLSQAP